jgi:hypothetical protein
MTGSTVLQRIVHENSITIALDSSGIFIIFQSLRYLYVSDILVAFQ